MQLVELVLRVLIWVCLAIKPDPALLGAQCKHSKEVLLNIAWGMEGGEYWPISTKF